MAAYCRCSKHEGSRRIQREGSQSEEDAVRPVSEVTEELSHRRKRDALDLTADQRRSFAIGAKDAKH